MSKIVTVPNEILRLVAEPVVQLDKRVLNMIEDMVNTLKEAKNPEGVGLAAPQIGVSSRIFLIRPTPKDQVQVFINPEIIKFSQRQTKPTSKNGVYEGCLSIPQHYAPVTRSMSVTVKYQTVNNSPRGELIEKTSVFSGFAAHVIQHEMDHLNGILFIDRVLEQNSPLYKTDGDHWQQITL